jgi:putative endonuclease
MDRNIGDDLKPRDKRTLQEESGAMISATNSATPLRKYEESPAGHFVYMVQCSNYALYTGYTTNVEKRVAAHNARKGSKYTRAHLPVILVASWSFSSKREALRVERAIKRLSRARKKHLVEQTLQSHGVLPRGIIDF